MITAIHTLIYSDDAAATRTFFKDVLRWPHVCEPGTGDEGRGDEASHSVDPHDWLIFATGPSELGVHPTVSVHEGKEYRSERQHQIALMCDDLESTVAELTGRGAEFTGGSQDMGFGLGALLKVPGADDLLLYEPRHAVAYDRS